MADNNIRSTSHWGRTVYQNIETGETTHTVVWGGGDWFLAIGLVSGCAALVLMFVTMSVETWVRMLS